MAVELTRNMSRQPSRESNNGSMNSYSSEGKSVNRKPQIAPTVFNLLLPVFCLTFTPGFVHAVVCLRLLVGGFSVSKMTVLHSLSYCCLKLAVITGHLWAINYDQDFRVHVLRDGDYQGIWHRLYCGREVPDDKQVQHEDNAVALVVEHKVWGPAENLKVFPPGHSVSAILVLLLSFHGVSLQLDLLGGKPGGQQSVQWLLGWTGTSSVGWEANAGHARHRWVCSPPLLNSTVFILLPQNRLFLFLFNLPAVYKYLCFTYLHILPWSTLYSVSCICA